MAKRRKLSAPPGVATPPQTLVASTDDRGGKTTRFLLPNGYTLGIGWKPVPPGVENLHVELSALLVDTSTDWGEEALNIAREEERKEPGDSLLPNHGRVIVRTALARIGFMTVGSVDRYPDGRHLENKSAGAPTYFSFPPTTFEIRFSEADQLVRLDRLFTSAERVRNYLAFSAKMPLPVVAVLSSKGFLYPERMECDPPSYAPPHAPKDRQEYQTWCQMYETIYRETRTLLVRVPPEGPLGRAIALVGKAIWSRDHEERLLYGWRSLEVVGNLDLVTARRKERAGDNDALTPYVKFGVAALVESQPVKLDALAKVAVSVCRRLPSVPPSRIEDLYELRNAVAHGDVSAEQHASILRAAPEAIALAKQIVDQVVGETLGSGAEGKGRAEG